MNYHIYCNQKNIQAHYQDAIAEFSKRLSSYCNTDLHPTTTLSELSRTFKSNHSILWITASQSTYDSMEFADFVSNLQQHGNSTIHIAVGYSNDDLTELYQQLGYDISVTHMSITAFSLSSQTICLLFYEQLYRAYTILQGKTYHK